MSSLNERQVISSIAEYFTLCIHLIIFCYVAQDTDIVVSDTSKLSAVSGMDESKSVGTFSPLQKQDGQKGLFVDRGVGSPRLSKSSSSSVLKLDSETKVNLSVFPFHYYQKMFPFLMYSINCVQEIMSYITFIVCFCYLSSRVCLLLAYIFHCYWMVNNPIVCNKR